MSIDTCASCAAAVDTDFDVNCYVEREGVTMCLCRACRVDGEEE